MSENSKLNLTTTATAETRKAASQAEIGGGGGKNSFLSDYPAFKRTPNALQSKIFRQLCHPKIDPSNYRQKYHEIYSDFYKTEIPKEKKVFQINFNFWRVL
jgi:hypothetical protein